MALEEICDLLKLEIQVRYVPDAVGPWITNLIKPYGEVFFKESNDDCMARSCTGWGKTPEESIANFKLNLFKSELKYIVIQKACGDRQKFGIPRRPIA